jgi:type III pantothenate kinase
MELVIDIGNSSVKSAVFINNGIHKVYRSQDATEELYDLIKDFDIKSIIISSVRVDNDEVVDFWTKRHPTLFLSHETEIPVVNKYKTPETLGKDRLAAVIGARFLFPNDPVLAIDAGTCITFDVLTKNNEYLGGNISPGARLRFKAMDEFTSALPLVDDYEFTDVFGRNTEESMASGVINGLVYEIEGAMSRYEEAFPGLKSVLCGGEARYFVNHLKKEIFANQNLVLLGLHKILKFNEQKLFKSTAE